MKSISKSMEMVRDKINETIIQNHLINNTGKWYQICSCMDVIEDTELAINSYNNNYNPKDDGDKYILLYGVLQAMFLQQDAVRYLMESLGIEFQQNNELKAIRDIRNESIGHPTKRGKGKKTTYHFIVRVGIDKNKFDIMTTFNDKRSSDFKSIDLTVLFKIQEETLILSLESVMKCLATLKKEIKMRFTGNKLVKLFKSNEMEYALKCVVEAAYNPIHTPKGSFGVKVVNEKLEEFKTGMKEREFQVSDYEEEIDLIIYAADKLEKYFSNIDDTLQEKDAQIFAYYISNIIEGKFISWAEDVDDVFDL